VAIGFAKVIHFDETLQRQNWTLLTFNSLKEIDVAFVKQQIHEAILIDEKIVKARRRKYK
jgi:hypothetical protein